MLRYWILFLLYCWLFYTNSSAFFSHRRIVFLRDVSEIELINFCICIYSFLLVLNDCTHHTTPHHTTSRELSNYKSIHNILMLFLYNECYCDNYILFLTNTFTIWLLVSFIRLRSHPNIIIFTCICWRYSMLLPIYLDVTIS